MKIQKIGEDSLLLVLDTSEITENSCLRQCVREAMRQEGLSFAGEPELTAYTAGTKMIVFVSACAQCITYFGFDSAEALLNAAYEAGRLFPETAAQLYRGVDRFYLATSSGKAAALLREYTWDVRQNADLEDSAEVLIAAHAFEILSGRC